MTLLIMPQRYVVLSHINLLSAEVVYAEHGHFRPKVQSGDGFTILMHASPRKACAAFIVEGVIAHALAGGCKQ